MLIRGLTSHAENIMKSRAVVCFGFSLCLLIGVFTLWGGLSLSTLTGLQISDILKSWSVPLQLALSITLFLALLKRKPLTKNFLRVSALLSGALILGGFALLSTFTFAAAQRIPVEIIAAILIGFGYGMLLLLWQQQLSRFLDSEVIKILLLALVISSALFLILVPLLPRFEEIVFVIVVLCSIILCLASNRLAKAPQGAPLPPDRKNLIDNAAEAAIDTPTLFIVNDTSRVQSNKREAFWKSLIELRNPLFCVSAIAVAVALTRAIALDGMADGTIVNIASSIGTIMAALILYFLWFGVGKNHAAFGKQNIPGLYRLFFPVIATALLLLSIFGNNLGLAVSTLVGVVFSVVSVLIMSTSITTAREQGTSSVQLYGIFAGWMYFVFVAATALGAWVYYPKNFGAATFSVIVLLVLYILAMSYVAIQKRKKKDTGAAESKTLDSDTETAEAPLPEKTVIDKVAQRCSILGTQHQLTMREKDILLLVARGRDVPNISKHLFISENTIRSHSKNIYKKLDIHSKQELLDLLETIPLDTTSR